MARTFPPNRRALVLGGSVIATGALCALLFHARSPDPAASAPQPRAAATAVLANHRSPARIAAPSEAEEPADDEPEEAAVPVSRGAEYSAAFDRKMARKLARLAEDCEGNDVLVHALDGFGEVRDRIVASAVATDNGLKTKAAQLAYERAQITAYNAVMCRAIAGETPSKQCKIHFRSCADLPGEN